MFEIRSYHYDPTQFEAYKRWAIDHAVPFLLRTLPDTELDAWDNG